MNTCVCKYEDNVGMRVHVMWVGEGVCVYINYRLSESVGMYVCKWADTWVYVCVRCSCGVFVYISCAWMQVSFVVRFRCHISII